MKKLAELRQNKAALVAKGLALLDSVSDSASPMTPEQETALKENETALAQINSAIAARERLLGEQQSLGNAADTPRIEAMRDLGAERPFACLGEQLQAVIAVSNSDPDPEALSRLRHIQAAATGLGVSVGSDAGFLVQTDFTTSMMALAHDTGVLSRRCMRVPIGPTSDSLEAPLVKQSSRATGSRWGGVQVYRKAEADTVTATKPDFDKWELRLEEMMALCYATGRSLQDAPALEAIIRQAYAEEMGFKMDDEIIRGTGVGQCLGILNSSAKVSVTKETGQAADTIVAENVMAMYSRLWSRSMAGAEWFINQDCWTQLFQLHLAVGTGGVPLFMPPAGLVSAPYGTLFGRPIQVLEQCATLGDEGDIVLADFSQYVLIEKGGVAADTSIHVRFLYDEQAFRFITRNNGAPKWKTALTPYKGSNSVSPFITLAARA